MYHNCASLCSLSKDKEGAKQFIYQLFSWIAGIKTNMLLIIFLGLTAKLMSVSSECVVGTAVLKNFDFTKVGIIALKRSPETSNF